MNESEDIKNNQGETEDLPPRVSDMEGVEEIGSEIGKYKILSVLGEGGCGVVYLAERARPVRRRVALKVIKPGMDTKQVIARFEAERQALALLDHPNIAQVYDAGTTENGRPYFVMEYVKGVPIIEHCDRQKLGIDERLKLFILVCDAVQHSHQKAIIHRDIKPSNILVAISGNQSIPKIIDFGVAKALAHQLTDLTLVTEQGQVIGTPEYMSPEQAEMTNQDIDTRSDIYSLGVVLYELLTGALPFESKTLREGGFENLRQVIREQEPKTPSTRLNSIKGERLTKIVEQRHSDIRTLSRRLRGDLDWITLRAMEKDRTRRYETANGLGMDIQRHLNHEPVAAGPPGVMYRMGKFVRRYRRTLTMAACILVVGAIGLVFGLSQYKQARESDQKASQAEAEKRVAQEKAETERRIARETVERSEALSALSAGQDFVSRAEYAKALAVIEPILESEFVGAEARLLRARCRLMTQVSAGRVIEELEGLLNEEAQVAGAAHGLLAQIYLASDLRSKAAAVKVNYHQAQAESLLPETAEAYFLRAMTTDAVQETLGLLSKAVELDRSHYASLKARALAYYALGDWRRMERDAVAMITLRGVDSLGYSLLAIALRETGLADEAMGYHHKAIELSADDPELYDQRRETYVRLGNHDEALADARQCVRLKPQETKYEFDVFCHLTGLGRFDEAKAWYSSQIGSNPSSRKLFYVRSARYVSRILGHDALWHPEGKQPAGAAFLGMVEGDEQYRYLSSKAQWIAEGFGVSWSPDGRKLAFSQGVLGFSGIAVYDMDTGKRKLLITPGKDPMYSPDGKLIAYVRNRQILPLAHFSVDREGKHARSSQQEVWVMNADGTSPRRLAQGEWPSWGSDSRRVFYVRTDRYLYSVSIDATDQQQMPYGRGFRPAVSPDGKYAAYPSGNKLRIVELATGSTDTWVDPGNMYVYLMNWSSDGSGLCFGRLGGLGGMGKSPLGLWNLDLTTRKVTKLLSGKLKKGMWSPDGQHLAIASIDARGIWIARGEDIGEGQTLEDHYREVVRWTSRRIEAGILLENNRSSRVEAYLGLKETAKAAADQEWLKKHRKGSSLQEALVSQAAEYNDLAWRLITGPEEMRNPEQALRLAQQSAKMQPFNPDFLNTLGAALYRSGKYKQALMILQTTDGVHKIKHPGGVPRDVAFIAMAQYRLGQGGEAKKSLERLRALVKAGSYAGDPEAQGLLREAEAVLGREQEKL